MSSFTAWNSELYHHGIKGQKWGIRRYQNSDGTLTEEGKNRYKQIHDQLLKSRERIYNKDPNYFSSERSNEVWNTKLGKYIWRVPDSIRDQASTFANRSYTNLEVLARHKETYGKKPLNFFERKALTKSVNKYISAIKDFTIEYADRTIKEIDKQVPKKKRDYYKSALYEAFNYNNGHIPDYENIELELLLKNR